MNAKDALDELKWHPDKNFSNCIIFYVHRGAPGDQATVMGSDIVEMEHSFFHTEDAAIPYHRIFRIECSGKVIFQRNK